jgi:prepilin-type N-terminal cleavage/methylation domain-containing protein
MFFGFRVSQRSSISLNQKGFTLVEILVATLIASILLLAVVRLFTKVGEHYEINAETLRTTSLSQTAINYIKNDVTQAGYMGCVMTDVTRIEPTAQQNIDKRNTKTQPYITGGSENFVSAIYGVDSGNPRLSDSLSLFYQEDLDIRVLDFDAEPEFGTKGLVVEYKNLKDDSGNTVIGAGDWLTISDCAASHAFIMTENLPTAPLSAGIRYSGFSADNLVSVVKHDTTSFNGYSNGVTQFKNFGFAPSGGAATVNKLHHVTYRVTYSKLDYGATDSLFRLVNGEQPSVNNELVRSVKNFQIEFGIDNDYDGVADQFSDPSSNVGNNVVAVRIKLDIASGTRTESIENIFKLRNRGM